MKILDIKDFVPYSKKNSQLVYGREGFSYGNIENHQKFTQKHGLKLTLIPDDDLYKIRVNEQVLPFEMKITIPKKFQHVKHEAVYNSGTKLEELMVVLKKVHPWSSFQYSLSAIDVVRKLYIEWIPKYFGNNCEIQILSTMTRGSLGNININQMIQETANPAREGTCQLKMGEKIFRQGDRVIHRRTIMISGVG